MPLIATSVALSVSPASPSDFETNLLLTALVTASSANVPGPTGNVIFFDGVSPILTVPLTNLTGSTGQAQMQIASLTVGAHNLTAQYSGDGNFSGNTSTPPTVYQVLAVLATSANFLPGFALIASYSALGDSSLPPQATVFAVPFDPNPHQDVTIVWDTINVAFVRIQGNNHVDYQSPPPPGSALGFDTGFLSTTGSGIYPVPNGFTAPITLTLTAYDASQNPLGVTSSTFVAVL